MHKRLTLVVSNQTRRSWNRNGVSFVKSLAELKRELAAHDVERVILDHSASADQLLHFLAALPHEMTGDVLSVRHDGSAYLSSTGRGGDRVLYVLTASDLDFYLETNSLTKMRTELARIA